MSSIRSAVYQFEQKFNGGEKDLEVRRFVNWMGQQQLSGGAYDDDDVFEDAVDSEMQQSINDVGRNMQRLQMQVDECNRKLGMAMEYIEKHGESMRRMGIQLDSIRDMRNKYAPIDLDI